MIISYLHMKCYNYYLCSVFSSYVYLFVDASSCSTIRLDNALAVNSSLKGKDLLQVRKGEASSQLLRIPVTTALTHVRHLANGLCLVVAQLFQVLLHGIDHGRRAT
jgi:hypothetical protein